MTYADARYELLNMGISVTKVFSTTCDALVCVTRWSADSWEVNTLGKYFADLTSTLTTLGFQRPDFSTDAGAMVAEYQHETGCDWSTALVACNCD